MTPVAKAAATGEANPAQRLSAAEEARRLRALLEHCDPAFRDRMTALAASLGARTSEARAAADGIAKAVMNIETLEAQNSDGLDFHDLSVWTLQRALVCAYLEGYCAGARAGAPQSPR